MTYTPFFVGFYALWIFLLGGYVSLLRMTLKISMGDGENKTMRNGIRAHANALEHMIPFLLVLYFCELRGVPKSWVLWIGIAFGAGRILHALGMIMRKINIRRTGATITVILELAVVVLLLWKLFA